MKKLINIVVILFAIGGLYACVVHFISLSPQTQMTSVPRATMNYTRQICDDAYTTEKRYDDRELSYVDAKLQEGCFSGHIGLPRKWRSYQWQLLGNNGTDWAAEWWSGSPVPLPPQWGLQVNTANQNLTLPSSEVRVEGRGTLRFYCTIGCPEHPILPDADPAKSK